ncbi:MULTISPECIES: hypothetical protein [unclassified Novosphingobium]|uniref:hypothetical protein n=1 Tax=unclassified Novosphingobium TaxID=2644732 RepID=UPI00146AFB09|nr:MULTISPECIES: hypothetical protein [unclassified Novosphingobium]NMN04581.1 hypothetical protein [Novosphingobium sp. SG919]NMN85426.1 hypothetical protein [Novosphingobium sp. SG916]
MAIETTRARPALRALLAAVLLGGAAQAAAQPATPAIEGVWKIATPTTTLKPVAGAVPFTAEGRKAYEANRKLRAQNKIDDYDITLSRCSNPGVPRLALSPMRFKIWYRQGVVTFDYEWNRALRQINVGVPPQPDLLGQGLVPTATGKSKGHWEGDTLVSVMEGASDRTLIDDLVPHGYDLKVTERYRLLDADTLEDRITIEDPAYFTHPWEAVVTYKRQPDAIFPEDVCLDRITAHKPAFPG